MSSHGHRLDCQLDLCLKLSFVADLGLCLCITVLDSDIACALGQHQHFDLQLLRSSYDDESVDKATQAPSLSYKEEVPITITRRDIDESE